MNRSIVRPRRGIVRVTTAALLAVAAVTAALVVPTTQAGIAQSAPPTVTSDRAFYAMPGDVARYAPGAIVRMRPVVVRAMAFLPMAVDSWQVLYRTTSETGAPIVTAATLIVRRGTTPTQLFSMQSATDAVAKQCQPSRALRATTPIDFGARSGPITVSNPAVDIVLAGSAVAQGWGVVISDYGGLDGQFLVSGLHAHAILDGIRAAQRFPAWKMNSRTPVGMFGYSGGGMATSIAIENQPSYAPELVVRGAVSGAPLRDVGSALRLAQGSPTSGLVPMGLAALIKRSPSHEAEILRDVTPWGRAKVKAALNQCTGEAVVEALWLDYSRFFSAPIGVVLNRPYLKRALADVAVTDKRPTAPVYIYKALSDELISTKVTDQLVRGYCAGPAAVTYRREVLPPNPIPALNSPHVIEMAAGLSPAMAWLKARMASSATPPRSCDVATVTSTAFEPGGLQQFPTALRSALEMLLGVPVS